MEFLGRFWPAQGSVYTYQPVAALGERPTAREPEGSFRIDVVKYKRENIFIFILRYRLLSVARRQVRFASKKDTMICCDCMNTAAYRPNSTISLCVALWMVAFQVWKHPQVFLPPKYIPPLKTPHNKVQTEAKIRTKDRNLSLTTTCARQDVQASAR